MQEVTVFVTELGLFFIKVNLKLGMTRTIRWFSFP